MEDLCMGDGGDYEGFWKFFFGGVFGVWWDG